MKPPPTFGIAESLAEERDFRDISRVWDAHGDRPEHGLEIVRQLGPSGISGVHRDENAATPNKTNLSAFEHEFSLTILEGEGRQS